EVEADLGQGEIELACRPLERTFLAGEVGTEIDDGNGFGGGHDANSKCADQRDDRTQSVYGPALGRASMAFGILALMVASLFTGAAIYVTLVEHPARSVLEPGAQLEAWKPSYRRSAAMRASLAVIGFALGIAAWWTTGDRRWLAGALLLVASWPFTLVIL